MNREKVSIFTKRVVIAVGAICIVAASATLPRRAFTWEFLFMVVFGMLVAPRMSLMLPRSKFAVSFSDSLIFLGLVLYGGSATIVLAALETYANCIYLKSKKFPFGRLMIPANVAITALTTGLTFLGWYLFNQVFFLELSISKTPQLITAMSALALIQFLVSSTLAAVFQSLFQSAENGTRLWTTWKKDCFSSSMTQIVGAGFAALAYKIINYGDLATAGIVFAAVIIAYLNYRQSIVEINGAIAQVEEAERQKSEAERERRREAERHASELSLSLQKEERANFALRKSEKDFEHAALHDSLTGLANRKRFGDILSKLISEYKKDPSTNFQVLFLDIRSFKNINDSLGHSVGDQVLQIAAKRFVRAINEGDTVARIGGDEFAIILRNLATTAKAQKVARRIYDNITQPFSLCGNQVSIDINIGIASCDAEYNTPEEILRDADIAMHYAKERNEGPAVFNRELRARFLERVRLEMDLRHAVQRGELSLHYQPIVSLGDGRLVGFEALLRWQHSEFGMIPPSKFISVAEYSGLIQPITVWILREACQQLVRWQSISVDYRSLIMSVNISGKHFSNDDLIDDVENALEESGVAPRSLKLEITETSAMENAQHTINVLNKLKQIGVQLSIDDFGTGYSSLSYLQRLPFDTLKIDRSFVCNVGDGGENSEILQTIISLAKNLKMRVIAEGIETQSQLAVLTTLGCDFGQGYLLARPKGKNETESLLYRHPNLLPSSEENVSTTDSPASEISLPIF